ncbi:MAG: rod shape-determining protein MreD [Oscillospiraceae bacterium]|nr:rod shape-determining protein MreD [Oscillospiraceae bacterium]
MSQRNALSRWIFYALAAGWFLFLQGMLFNRLQVWGIHPFLPPVLAVIAAVWEDRQESLCAGAVFGLLCDLAMRPPIPCFYVLTFSAAAFFAGLIAKRWIQPGFFCALAVSLASLVLTGAFDALVFSVRGINDPAAAVSIMGRELLLTLPLIPLVYLLFRHIRRRFPAE